MFRRCSMRRKRVSHQPVLTSLYRTQYPSVQEAEHRSKNNCPVSVGDHHAELAGYIAAVTAISQMMLSWAQSVPGSHCSCNCLNSWDRRPTPEPLRGPAPRGGLLGCSQRVGCDNRIGLAACGCCGAVYDRGLPWILKSGCSRRLSEDRQGPSHQQEAAARAMGEEGLSGCTRNIACNWPSTSRSACSTCPTFFPDFNAKQSTASAAGRACSRDDLRIEPRGKRKSDFSRLEMTVRPPSPLQVAGAGRERNDPQQGGLQPVSLRKDRRRRCGEIPRTRRPMGVGVRGAVCSQAVIANDVAQTFSHAPSLPTRRRPPPPGTRRPGGVTRRRWSVRGTAAGADRIKITLLGDEVPVRRIHLERPPEIISRCLAL